MRGDDPFTRLAAHIDSRRTRYYANSGVGIDLLLAILADAKRRFEYQYVRLVGGDEAECQRRSRRL